MNFADHGSGDRRRIGRRARDEEHAAGRLLLLWKVGCDLAVGFEPVLFHDAHDADDGVGLLGIEP